MKNIIHLARATVRWLWRRTAAGVAMVLIVAALALGFRAGRSSAPTDAVVSDVDDHADHDHQQSSKQQIYTCSMHPSVRLLDPAAKCPICGMSVIPVADAGAAGAADDAERQLTLSASAIERASVMTAPVERRFPTATVRMYGKATYDETSVARITAYFPARIDRLFVNYVGSPVNKGEHIAEVYSPELLAAFEELRQAVQASRQAADAVSNLVKQSTNDTLAAARDKLRLFGLTDEQIHAVESGEYARDRLTVYAPIGGVVTHLAVREGDYVSTGEPIATVADLSRLWLDLQAYESQLPMLRWGQSVEFTVAALPGETFTGRIAFIEPMIDNNTRTAAVRVAVENPDGRLKPGMFATAIVRSRLTASGVAAGDELAGKWVGPMHPTIIKNSPGKCDICGMDLVPAESLGAVGDLRDATPPLVAPRSAILFTGVRSVVYVEVPNAVEPTYEAREVVLGPRAGDDYVIREGLHEGERVVVQGAFRIDSAMQIEAKPSMMAPEGSDAPPAHQHSSPAGAPNQKSQHD